MSEAVNEKKFTAKEAADALGVTEACVRKMILLRRISSYHIGRAVRIGQGEIERILRDGHVPAREAGQ